MVVFAAPQLSIVEMQQLAALCRGATFQVPVIVCTAPQVIGDARRMGFTAQIEAAGGTILEGTCFCNGICPRNRRGNGWVRLLSNSAKIVNILGGYGYKPALASMENCVASAIGGYPMIKELKCHAGVGPKVTGIALVADDNFSARYDLDRIKGFPGHNTNLLANLTRIKFWFSTRYCRCGNSLDAA